MAGVQTNLLMTMTWKVGPDSEEPLPSAESCPAEETSEEDGQAGKGSGLEPEV